MPPPAHARTRPRSSRAFTLIELVVVVVIIAVLAAIAGLGYNTFTSRARSAATHATAIQVDKALTARSVRDDVDPRTLVKAAVTDPQGFEGYLGIRGNGATFTPDDPAAPTTLRVALGGHTECLTLGTVPGAPAAIEAGTCAAAPPSGPVAAPSTMTAAAIAAVSGTASVIGTATLRDGSVVVTGTFSGTATFGSTTLTSAGSGDVLVAKLTPNGTWAWAVRGGGTGNDVGNAIAVDASGDLVITGYVYGAATFGSTSLVPLGGYDAVVAKLSATGSWTWAVNGGSATSGGTDGGYGVAVDTAGNVFISGSFTDTATFGSTVINAAGSRDMLVAKLTSAGAWVWAVRGGGNTGATYAQKIALDPAGNVLVDGYFSGTSTFGTIALTASYFDVFVAKLTPAGAWTWVVRGGGTGLDTGYGIAVGTGGNVFVTGTVAGSATFGPVSVTSAGGADVLVAKLSPTGTWLWANRAGGSGDDNGFAVAADGSENLFLVGNFVGSARFGPVTLTSGGGTDVVAAKLAPDGTWVWAARGGGGGDDNARAVALDAGGNPVAAGTFTTAATFGTTALDAGGANHQGGLVVRWNADGTLS